MTINRHVKDTLIFISSALLISCLTPIEFPADIGNQRIIITGQVSTISDRNTVHVEITAKTQRRPFPIEGATVKVVDERGSSFYYLENKEHPGEYILDGFSAEPGVTYFLSVAIPNGDIYESTPERMPITSGGISTSFDISKETITDNESTIDEKSFLKIFAKSTIPDIAENVYLKWSVEEVFAIVPTDFPDIAGFVPPNCYVYQNADPQRILLFNGANVKTNSIDNNLVGSRVIDWTFLDRHYFTTYQSSITKEAYDYWYKVKVLATQVGSIFDTPPAEITGNIRNVNKPSEKVIGYFQTVNQSFDRFFVLSHDLPFPLLLTNCTYDNRSFDKYPSRCLECINVHNSSYERPDWF